MVTDSLFFVLYYKTDNIPKSGRIIFASNHRSYIDPILIHLAANKRRKPIHFMAKSEMFNKNIMLDWFWNKMYAFPVRRGLADREAIKKASEILKNDGALGIFPEGTRVRGDKISAPQEGMAYIAVRDNALIIPIAVIGTNKLHPVGQKHIKLFLPFKVVFGTPIHPDGFEGDKKKRISDITDYTMNKINTLIEENPIPDKISDFLLK
jgi:1-acyl-sn-glycerol-3-phosphate acyltransferase